MRPQLLEEDTFTASTGKVLYGAVADAAEDVGRDSLPSGGLNFSPLDISVILADHLGWHPEEPLCADAQNQALKKNSSRLSYLLPHS